MSRIDTRLAGQSRSTRVLYAVFRTAICGFIRVYTRLSITGAEHLPITGAYVLAPVHRSYVDTPIAACLTRRRIRFMGKDSMWKFPAFGKLISALGAFPVSRGTVDREALQRCITVLGEGEPLVLFPEGERKDGPIVQPLFDGAAFVAARAGVPIIPVGIGGSDRVMPRKAKFIHPRKVRVIIGPPISAEVGPNGKTSRHAVKDATTLLHSELQRLYDEVTEITAITEIS